MIKKYKLDIANFLHDKDIPFEIISFDLESFLHQQSFPIQSWGKIDWENFEGKTYIYDFNDNESAALCAKKLFLNLFNKDQKTIISYSSETNENLMVRLFDILDYLWEVFDEDFDTWILDEAGMWCCERYHEGDLTLGIKGS